MRYATWSICFDESEKYGTLPKGLEGIFEYAPNSIAGYILDETDISELNQWQVQEINAVTFLDMAQQFNSECFLIEGKLSAPKVNVNQIPI
jgi:hypothetical protein